MADDAEVVSDEYVGELEVVLEVLEQVDDLGLDRDVEGGDGFVGDDQLRAQRERPRDPDPLALTTGELVRVAVVMLGVEADRLQQVLDHALDLPRLTIPCSSIGSPTIWAMRLRGLSDEYGSWKTIWMSRRNARDCCG